MLLITLTTAPAGAELLVIEVGWEKGAVGSSKLLRLSLPSAQVPQPLAGAAGACGEGTGSVGMRPRSAIT